MRKQTKLVAVLSAAALLAIGASMTSFAATPHWDQEDGEWVYLDRNGDKVTGEWKKSNGQWYYLDEDGYMAKDALIEYNDSRYYVDTNGVKVTNAWVSMDNDDLLDDDEVTTVWFYFDSKGKAVGSGNDKNDGKVIKSIAYGDGQKGYFIFNDSGVMLTGWQEFGKNNDYYYLGDENQGWALTGWQYLEPDDEEMFEQDSEDEPYDDEVWFWFGSDGKAAKGKNKQIGGKWYAFDKNGVMQDLWVYGTGSKITNKEASSTTATTGDAASRYHAEDNGGRDKNWIWAYANTKYDDYDDDMYWFYLNNKGQPVLADPDKCEMPGLSDYAVNFVNADKTVDYNGHNYGIKVEELNKSGSVDWSKGYALIAKSIKNKTYIFDDAGRMRSGLFAVYNVDRGSSTNALCGYYYFTDDSNHGSTDGQMVTNRKMTIEVDGEDKTYYFDKTGRAYTNTIVSSSLYGMDGALVDGHGDGATYERVFAGDIIYGEEGEVFPLHEKGKSAPVDIKNVDIEYVRNGKVVDTDKGAYVLLNGNGKIKKSGTVTDIDGYKVTVKDYLVVKIEETK